MNQITVNNRIIELADSMTSTTAMAFAPSQDDSTHRKAARHWVYRHLDPGRQAATRRWWEALGVDLADGEPVQVVTPDDLVDALGYGPEQAKDELAADGILLPWMS